MMYQSHLRGHHPLLTHSFHTTLGMVRVYQDKTGGAEERLWALIESQLPRCGNISKEPPLVLLHVVGIGKTLMGILKPEEKRNIKIVNKAEHINILLTLPRSCSLLPENRFFESCKSQA